MKWTLLPSETQLQVASFADCRTLKSLRQSGKQHGAAIATSFLFQELWISRNKSSVRRVENIATEPLLRRHVTSIVFDMTVFDGPVLETFEGFRARVQAGLKQWLASEPMAYVLTEKQLVQLYRACLEEESTQSKVEDPVDGHETREEIMIRKFSKIFQKLTSLRISDRPSNFTRTAAGLVLWPKYTVTVHARGSSSNVIVAASRMTRVVELDLRAVRFGLFAGIQDSFTSGSKAMKAFRNLRKLDLALQEEENTDDIWSSDHTVFSRFLQYLSPTLTHLAVCFDQGPTRDHAATNLMTDLVIGHRWIQLKFLKLQRACLHEDRFIEFLIQNAKQLTSLHLSNILIIKDLNNYNVKANIEDLGSVLSLLWRIPRCCNLLQARLDGVLTNGLTEAWDDTKLVDCHRSTSVRGKFEDFLCNRGSWPFLDLKIWRRLASRRLKAWEWQAFIEAKAEQNEEADMYELYARRPTRPIASAWNDSSWRWMENPLRIGEIGEGIYY